MAALRLRKHFQRWDERSDYQNLISFTGTGGTASGEYPNWQPDTQRNNALRHDGHGGTNGDRQHLQRWHGRHKLPKSSFLHRNRRNGTRPVPEGSLTLGGTTLYGMTKAVRAAHGNIFSVGRTVQTTKTLFPSREPAVRRAAGLRKPA